MTEQKKVDLTEEQKRVAWEAFKATTESVKGCVYAAAAAVLAMPEAPTERRFTLEEVEKVIIATLQGWNRKPIHSIETFCKVVRSRLLVSKPVERVLVYSTDGPKWRVSLNDKLYPVWFSCKQDAEHYAAVLRAELAKQEGA